MAQTISQQVTFIGVQRPGEVEEDSHVDWRGNYTAAVRSQHQRDVSEKSKNRSNERCFILGLYSAHQQHRHHETQYGIACVRVRSVFHTYEAGTWLWCALRWVWMPMML